MTSNSSAIVMPSNQHSPLGTQPEPVVRRINHFAVIVTAVAAFVFSSLYYSPFLLGTVWLAVDPTAAAGMKPSIGRVLGEIARTLMITYVLAHLLALLGSQDWKSGVRLALKLWFGFSFMMWIGAIMWENTPWPVAAIHTGDWLVKTVLMAFLLGIWRDGSVKRVKQS